MNIFVKKLNFALDKTRKIIQFFKIPEAVSENTLNKIYSISCVLQNFLN